MSDHNNSLISVNLPDMPKSIDNAAKSLTTPLAQSIGQTLSDCWQLVFGGISYTAEKQRIKYHYNLQKFKKELDDTIASIPKEDYAEPTIQLTAQALECSKYCISSESLRKMFVRLISGSMTIQLQDRVHPSFPETLKQMSETDAKIFAELYQLTRIPILTVNCYLTNSAGYQTIYTNFCSILDFDVDSCSLSLCALEKLGLVKLDYSKCIKNPAAYQALETHPSYLYIEQTASEFPNFKKLENMQGTCYLTSLGRAFAECCLSE